MSVPVQDLDFQCHISWSFLFIHWVKVIGDCLFTWYWWNCWQSLFNLSFHNTYKETSWSWSYGSWIYSYLCNQCLSPLMLWVCIPLRRGVFNTTLCDFVCQWLTIGRWFSPGTPVSSTNKTDRHDITEILLKVALNTINSNP